MKKTKNEVACFPYGKNTKSFVNALEGVSIISKGAVCSAMTTYMSTFFQEDVHVKEGILIESIPEAHNHW